MGLDVYLYTAEQAERNATYNKASEELYEEGSDGKSPRDKMSDDEYKEWSARYSYASMVNVPSERYPDHLFNRRYLRSSYNDSGFNHAVPQLIGAAGKTVTPARPTINWTDPQQHEADIARARDAQPAAEQREYPHERGSLYWIFQPMGREWDGDDGWMSAEDIDGLREAKARALDVVRLLQESDKLRVYTVSPNMFSAPPTTTDDEALAQYRSHLSERTTTLEGWYSTGNIDVFAGGIEIVAAIPGRATFNIPGVHLIYRATEAIDSYVQSAEITAEFCDEAISLIERDDRCQISWSG